MPNKRSLYPNQGFTFEHNYCFILIENYKVHIYVVKSMSKLSMGKTFFHATIIHSIRVSSKWCNFSISQP